MLSTAKSANIGFLQVVQLFAPPTNPAHAPLRPYGRKFKRLGLGLALESVWFNWFVLVLWTMLW